MDSVAIGRRDIGWKSHSGATDGCQCEDQFGKGSLTTLICLLFFPSLVSFCPCTYFLLPTMLKSTHPEYRIVIEELLRLHHITWQTRTSYGNDKVMLKAGNLYTQFSMRGEMNKSVYFSEKMIVPVLLVGWFKQVWQDPNETQVWHVFILYSVSLDASELFFCFRISCECFWLFWTRCFCFGSSSRYPSYVAPFFHQFPPLIHHS